MHLKHGKIGENNSQLDIVLVSKFLIGPNLLRIHSTEASNFKINLIVEGALNVKFFSSIPVATRLSFKNFVLSQNFDLINTHLAGPMSGQKIALHDSDYDFFIFLTSPLPSIQLSFKENTLEIPNNASLNDINIGLLTKPSNTQTSNVFDEKSACFDLRTIHEKVRNGHIFTTCYGIVLDCCDSYYAKPGESQDYLVSYKITDPSIFPDHANINIFHKDPKDIPKICFLGDVVVFNEIQFREYAGHVQGVIPNNYKNMSFHVFRYNDENCTPYANYKLGIYETYINTVLIKSLVKWFFSNFSLNIPIFIRNSKRLSDIKTGEEIDVIVNILGITSLGVSKTDPQVYFVGDDNQVFLLVIPHDREKLVR